MIRTRLVADVLPAGLRFVGYVPRPGQIRLMGREARRAAKGIAGKRAPLA